MKDHSHPECPHTEVAYCAKCQCCYCKACGMEWKAQSAVSVPNVWVTPEPYKPWQYPYGAGTDSGWYNYPPGTVLCQHGA